MILSACILALWDLFIMSQHTIIDEDFEDANVRINHIETCASAFRHQIWHYMNSDGSFSAAAANIKNCIISVIFLQKLNLILVKRLLNLYFK